MCCYQNGGNRALERKQGRCWRRQQVEAFDQEFGGYLRGNTPNPGGFAPGETRNTIRENDEE
jgi:hypothetical protein